MQILTNTGIILKQDPQVLFTCPTDNTTAIHTIFFTTISDEDSSFITIQVYDASEGKLYYVARNIEVMPNSTFTFDRPIYLDQNDQIKVFASTLDQVHAFASVMKIVPLSI